MGRRGRHVTHGDMVRLQRTREEGREEGKRREGEKEGRGRVKVRGWMEGGRWEEERTEKFQCLKYIPCTAVPDTFPLVN